MFAALRRSTRRPAARRDARLLVRLCLASVVSAVLVMTVVTPVQASELPQLEVPIGDPIDVLPESLSDPAELPPVEWPTGDYSGVGTDLDALAEQLEAAQPQRELGMTGYTPDPEVVHDRVPDDAIIAEQTELTNDYELPGGGRLLESSMFPINALDDEGEWVPVSTELSESPDGTLSTDAHPLDPAFAPTADAADAFSIERDGFDIGFTLLGAAHSEAVHLSVPRQDNTDRVTYNEVFDGVDLEYELHQAGVKEEIVLDALPDEADASWTWRIDTDGLDLRINPVTGDVEFVDNEGQVQFHVPSPIMWDSSGVEGESANATENVATHIEPDGEHWTLTLSPDYEWLADETRVFPIVVDPAVSYGPNPLTSYKSTGGTSSGVMLVGNSREGGANRYWRSIAKYGYTILDNRHLIGAALGLVYMNYSTPAYGGNVWTALDSCYSCSGTKLTGYEDIGTGAGVGNGVNLGIRYAKEVGLDNYGLTLMVTGDEAAAYTLKQYASRMYFTYTNYPSVTALNAPVSGSTNVSLTPVLTATGNDPTMSSSEDSELEHGLSFQFKLSEDPVPETDTVYTSEWTELDGTTGSLRIPAGILKANTKYYWRAYVKDAYDGVYKVSSVRKGTSVSHFTTNASVPFASSINALPATDTTQTTLTPRLSIDPVALLPGDVDPYRYQFRVATGANGSSGSVMSSGWQTETEWTVPSGVLQDGGNYYWTVLVDDGVEKHTPAPWANNFKVDLRLGTEGPSPFDSVGPATVNLANGNMNLSFGSPTVTTMGGSMGMSFTYNSREDKGQNSGLVGSYYSALDEGEESTTSFSFTGREPLAVRRDEQVNFLWTDARPASGGQPAQPAVLPAPPMDPNYFLVRWTGYIRVPAAGTYQFGFIRSGGVKMYLNNSTTANGYNVWKNTTVSTNPSWGSAYTFSSTAPVPVTIEYFSSTGDAAIELWAKKTSAPTQPPALVPGSWLTSVPETLPTGWSASSPLAGAASTYVRAKVSEKAVTVTDSSGGTHVFRSNGDGGYKPPAGEQSVLSLDAKGMVVLTDSSGTVYTFAASGGLSSERVRSFV